MAPEVFWHTPLSNAIVFAGVLILDILVAFFIYGILLFLLVVLRVKDERPA